MVEQFGVEFRHDRFRPSRDRYDAELQVGLGSDCGEFGNLHVQQRGVFLKAECFDLELAPCEIHRFDRGRMLEEVADLVSGQPFRIEHELDAHLLEQNLVLGCQIVVVADSGGHFGCAEILRQQGADYVHFLWNERYDRDEQVRMGYVGIPHSLDGRRRGENGRDVGNGCQGCQPFRIVVDHGNLVGFVAEHLGQM